MNKAVFLDRDGTIIVHVHYLADPDGVELVPQGPESLQKLRDAGYLLIVITNQSIIGRGTGTIEQVEAVNARMCELYAQRGILFDDVLYCPHAPEDNCPCRKPKPGMLLDAAQRHNIDLTQSVMIGDNPTDIGAGQAAGCAVNIFIGEGIDMPAVANTDSLAEAVTLL